MSVCLMPFPTDPEEQVLEEEKQAYQDRFGVAAPLITSIDIFGMFRKQERHLVRTYRWATLRKRLGT